MRAVGNGSSGSQGSRNEHDLRNLGIRGACLRRIIRMDLHAIGALCRERDAERDQLLILP